jgi:hypothetical protein
VTAAALVVAIIAGFAATAWQARRASQQAQLAQRRFSEARRLIYSVIHDIQPKLASIEGTIAVRASMVDQTMGYLEALGKDAGDSPPLLRELIEGYLELARLTGGGSDSNVGNVQRAGQILKKAEALLDTLLRLESSDPAAMRLAISVYRAVGLQEVQYGSEESGRAYTRLEMEGPRHRRSDRDTTRRETRSAWPRRSRQALVCEQPRRRDDRWDGKAGLPRYAYSRLLVRTASTSSVLKVRWEQPVPSNDRCHNLHGSWWAICII